MRLLLQTRSQKNVTLNEFQPRFNVATDVQRLLYVAPERRNEKKLGQPIDRQIARPPPSVWMLASDLINIDGPSEAGLNVARDRGLSEPPSRVPPRDFV